MTEVELNSMKTVAVIGGGITGMSALHYLQKCATEENREIQLILFEKDAQLGGKMTTVERDGYLMEVGADSIVARHSSVQPFIDELQMQDDVVYNATGVSYILRDQKLHAIPVESVFGIPMNLNALAESTLISEAGKKALEQDLLKQEVPFTLESSVGDFLTYYLGDEIVQKQIAPVLSGVYSGDLFSLTIGATLPHLLTYKKEFGSIMKGFEANKEFYERNAAKKFISFKNGLISLFNRIEATLENARIEKETSVTAIEKVENGYRIETDRHEAIIVDEVILTTPHQVAQKVLADEALNQAFESLQTGSIITVYLAYDLPNTVLPADGTGFIVSSGNDVDCNACTWTSKKWQHTSKNEKLLIRMFYKKNNPKFEQFSKMSNDELVEIAKNDCRKGLGITEEPSFVEISKWMDLMPIYNLQHKQAIQQLEQIMNEKYPKLHLAGSSYYGVGIGLCIQNGKEIAEKIIKG